MAAEPRVILASHSVAEDLAFIALRDVAEVVAERGVTDARVIGGHMVMLHVYRHGLGAELYRTTADADLGIPPFAAREAGLIEALEGRGYQRLTGNRFRRRVSKLEERVDEPFAIVDVLVPAYTCHAREDRLISDKLTTVEVPGLAMALSRPAVEMHLNAALSDGTEFPVSVAFPDEASALVLKAFAWQRRAAGKDVVDVWRMLEVLVAAGISLADDSSKEVELSREIVRTAFIDPRAAGPVALGREQRLSEGAVRERCTRIQALIRRALG